MDRQFTRPQRMLMWAYQEARLLDEAIREAQSTPEAEGPEAIFPMSVLGCAYAVAGQQSAALQMVEKTAGADRSILSRIGASSSVCSGLGDKDRAFELMEKALAGPCEQMQYPRV